VYDRFFGSIKAETLCEFEMRVFRFANTSGERKRRPAEKGALGKIRPLANLVKGAPVNPSVLLAYVHGGVSRHRQTVLAPGQPCPVIPAGIESDKHTPRTRPTHDVRATAVIHRLRFEIAVRAFLLTKPGHEGLLYRFDLRDEGRVNTPR